MITTLRTESHLQQTIPVMGFCSVDSCDAPAQRGGLCWAHVKQKSLHGRTTQKEERPQSPKERLTESAINYRDKDDWDGEESWEKTWDNLRKSAVAYADRTRIEALRAAMARLKAEGAHLGRLPRVPSDLIAQTVESLGSISQAAKALGVSRFTVWRALKSVRKVQDVAEP